MSLVTRNGKRWTVNECIQLQREFELLQLSVDEIALRHKRTPNAIMCKLDNEGFADYNVLYSNYYDLNSPIPIQRTKNDDETYDENDDETYDENDDETYDENDDNEEQHDDQDSVSYNGCQFDYDNLKAYVMRLDEQIMILTDILRKQSKNNGSFYTF